MDIILEALDAYAMREAKFELIRHNENITCQVEYNGCKYVLRIHKPIDGFTTSLVTNNKNEDLLIQNEVKLLLHMKNNGFDSLQSPIINRFGNYVTKLNDGTMAMLLTWVDGDPIKREEISKYALELGKLACRIHQAAKGFEGERIEYDNALCDRMIKEIDQAILLGHIKEETGLKCKSELEVIKMVQMKYEEDICIIHADLNSTNVLVTDKGLIPIDFSLAGYGSLAQEAGMLMSNFYDDESCQELLSGFRKSRQIIDPRDADIFLSYSVLLFICSQHHRIYREEWFKESLNYWCDNLFIHENLEK